MSLNLYDTNTTYSLLASVLSSLIVVIVALAIALARIREKIAHLESLVEDDRRAIEQVQEDIRRLKA